MARTLGTFRLSSFLLFSFLCIIFSTASAQEICNNGLDDDGDGKVDCYDPDCSGNAACSGFFFGQSAMPACNPPLPVSFNVDTNWASADPVLPGSSPIAGDIDGDGVVEIIICRGLTPGPNDTIFVIDGNTGLTENRFAVGFPCGGSTGDVIAIGDIDNDGLGEIVVVALNRLVHCFEHDGTQKWVSTVALETVSAPALADFDGNDTVEVYAGRQIFNGLTGNLIAQGSGSRGEGPVSMRTVAADVLPDLFCADCAGQELVAGDEVYSVDIAGGTMTVRTSATNSIGDGMTSLADYDDDGDLDGVVSGLGTLMPLEAYVYVWDLQTSSQIGNTMPVPASTTGYCGAATVGELDGDGRVEICVMGRNTIVVFDDLQSGNGVLWTQPLSDDSGFSNSAAFDFDLDGNLEIVCADQDSLRIFRGSDGFILSALPAFSGTIVEGPTVVDHDRDGQAEVLVCGAYPSFSSRTAQLMSIKPVNGSWAHCREVWNQVQYFNVNINDDLSIPKQQQQPQLWPSLNAFTHQSNLLDSLGNPLPMIGSNVAATAVFQDSLAGFTAHFTDLSVGSTIYSWQWDFGDGNSSMMQNPNHSYANPGTYIVCLSIIDSCGTDTHCDTVEIVCPSPSAQFTFTQSGDTLQVQNLSIDTLGMYVWTFGDGSSDTTFQPQHIYAAQDTYIVCLEVTDLCGVDTLCQTVIVTGLTGRKEMDFGVGVTIFPNPTSGSIYIEWAGPLPAELSYTLVDLWGRRTPLEPASTANPLQKRFDLPNLSKGVFILEIAGPEEKYYHRLLTR